MFTELLIRMIDGSSKSGNFGHKGRKGKVGGSAKSNNTSNKNSQMNEMLSEHIKDKAKQYNNTDSPQFNKLSENLISVINDNYDNKEYLFNSKFFNEISSFLDSKNNKEIVTAMLEAVITDNSINHIHKEAASQEDLSKFYNFIDKAINKTNAELNQDIIENHKKEVKQIGYNDLNLLYNLNLLYRNNSNSSQIKDYLKQLSSNPITDIVKASFKKPKVNNEKRMKAAAKLKTEEQRQTAEYIISNTPIADELYHMYKNEGLEEEYEIKEAAYNSLKDGAKTIYGFSSIKKYIRYSKEEDEELKTLINTIGYNQTTFRGEQLPKNVFNKLKIGQSYKEIKGGDIDTTNISSRFSVALNFAEDIDDRETSQSVLHIFEKSKAINTSNLSYYGGSEDEGFIDKNDQILNDIYYCEDKDCYVLLYKQKEG